MAGEAFGGSYEPIDPDLLVEGETDSGLELPAETKSPGGITRRWMIDPDAPPGEKLVRIRREGDLNTDDQKQP